MVQKIITAFRAKHKFNLSNERLQKQAEKWANAIENEEDIEAFIESADVEVLQEIAKLDDALRAKPKTEDNPPATPPAKEDEVPEWKVEMEKLREELSAANQASKEAKRKEALQTALNGTNEAFLKQVNRLDVSKFTDEEFEALKTELITDAESLNAIASTTKPLFGGTGTSATMKADKAKDIVSKI